MWSRRDPRLAARPRGVWYPDFVGVIWQYPRTLEEFQKKQAACKIMREAATANGTILNRVPNGWAGPRRRKMLLACRAKAAAEAKEIVMEMKKTGVMLDGEDPRGDQAIEMACEIMLAKDENNRAQKYAYPVAYRLQAAGLVAKFCKAPPATRNTTKIEAAEDFLGALLASSRDK